jgi:hypothetical protein
MTTSRVLTLSVGSMLFGLVCGYPLWFHQTARLGLPSCGGVGACANASFIYEYKVADRVIRASLGYNHSQGFVIGQAGHDRLRAVPISAAHPGPSTPTS